ncbi:MAG: flagellin [Clostridiales Family XIII bacterium]|nr:flagellin [Clostridiales Family XIII bacterium]
MIINNNISGLNAYNSYTINQGNTSLSLRKLASGLKINSAADNAALLAISEKMRSQTGGLAQSISNAYNGRNMVQTAEGALDQTHSALQRMRELAVQASNGIYTQEDRQQIQGEISQLLSEVTRISNDTEFNTKKLLNGDYERVASAEPGAVYGSKVEINLDSAITAGDYSVKLSGADAASATASVSDSGNVITGGAPTVTLSNGAAFGSYRFEATDNGGGDFTGRLTGPDGKVASANFSIGASASPVSFGDLGVSIDFSNVTAMSGGSFDINVAGNVSFDVTDQETGQSTSYQINGYKGEAIDLGGIQLADGIRTQADNTTGEALRVGISGDALVLHVGANKEQTISASFANVSAKALGINMIDLGTQEGAENAIGLIDEAINRVSSNRSMMGSVTNRLDHTIRSLSTTESNLTASESRIRDADMALEILNYTRNNILKQASISIMAQSRLMPQSILQLLQ